jgi:hypothetical protein
MQIGCLENLASLYIYCVCTLYSVHMLRVYTVQCAYVHSVQRYSLGYTTLFTCAYIQYRCASCDTMSFEWRAVLRMRMRVNFDASAQHRFRIKRVFASSAFSRPRDATLIRQPRYSSAVLCASRYAASFWQRTNMQMTSSRRSLRTRLAL